MTPEQRITYLESEVEKLRADIAEMKFSWTLPLRVFEVLTATVDKLRKENEELQQRLEELSRE